jgi:hypothetical protein
MRLARTVLVAIATLAMASAVVAAAAWWRLQRVRPGCAQTDPITELPPPPDLPPWDNRPTTIIEKICVPIPIDRFAPELLIVAALGLTVTVGVFRSAQQGHRRRLSDKEPLRAQA